MQAWRVGCAVLAGALSLLVLAPHGPSWLAWVALVPLFVGLEGASAGNTIGIAIIYALLAGVGSIAPWLARAAEAYFALAPWQAIGCTLAFLTMIFALHGALLGSLLLARPARLGPWTVVWCGAAWSCWDAARGAFFPHYPGAVLALSQHDTLPVLQIASVCGIGGASFVLVSANTGLAALLSAGLAKRRQRVLAVSTGLGIAAASVSWGALRLASGVAHPPHGGPRIVAVDVNARQPAESTLERYLAASSGVEAGRTGLLIWPESALTMDLEHTGTAWATLSRFVAGQGTPLLAGGAGSARRSDGRIVQFNSAHLVSPARGLQSYHKRTLVPFAERWPAILGDPPPEIAGLEAGRDVTVFRLGETAFGVLICFEITDAAGARALARRGATFIVNLTNDGWFTDAPHLPWAAVRAVETGLPVVRAANAGVSGVFDRFGRPVATGTAGDTPRLLAANLPPSEPTPYASSGDVFLAACFAVVFAGIVRLGARTKRPVR